MSESMSGGFEQLFGMSMKVPAPTGLRMTGDYSSADGFRLIFEPEAVTMVCRGVPEPTAYSVQMNGAQALIKLQSGPVLSFRSDGKLSGFGPIKVLADPYGLRHEDGELHHRPSESHWAKPAAAPQKRLRYFNHDWRRRGRFDERPESSGCNERNA
jgi:hypothetical protein